MSTLHVLHILNSTSGGSAISTLQLIQELKAKGVVSSLICFDNGTEGEKAAIAEVVEGRVIFRKLHWMNKRIRAKGLKRPVVEALDWWQTWGGYRYLRLFQAFADQQNIDLIHSSTLLNSEGMLLAKRLGVPHIIHGRELIGPGNPYVFYRFKHWVSRLEKSATKLVANSQQTFNNYAEYFNINGLSLIPNGIDSSKFEPVIHQDKSKVVIAMVGNLSTRWKNHPRFIELSLSCLQQNPNLEFRMYGMIPNSLSPELVRAKNKISYFGAEQSIKFMGHHPNPSEFLHEVDVLCHTADQESFGRVYVEAMAAGLPVVAVGKAGALDIVDHEKTGFLFTEDAEGVEYLLQLAEDAALRTQLGRAGRAKAEAEFGLAVLSQRVYTLYQKVLKPNE